MLLIQAAAVSVFAQNKPAAVPVMTWEDYAPLDSRELQDIKEIAGWNHLDISINTTDPGFPRTIHINREPEIQHEYVDLGLSVKWATCNVGADKPEDYGDYYAWGETEPKDVYDWSSYKWCTGSQDTIIKYNPLSGWGIVDSLTTLEPDDDVAHVMWGGDWRMPTASEFRELVDNCKWTWKSVNGINGYVVKSRIKGYRDRSIFLPAAGYCHDSNLHEVGKLGYYWSNSLFDLPLSAKSFYIVSDKFFRHYCSRFGGHSVRPVCP